MCRAIAEEIAEFSRGFCQPNRLDCGICMEIAEAAFHRPSRAGHAAFGDALASLSGGFRWLKLYGRWPLVSAVRKPAVIFGRSTSIRRSLCGRGRRYGLASRPAARFTTVSTPSATRRSTMSSSNTVRTIVVYANLRPRGRLRAICSPRPELNRTAKSSLKSASARFVSIARWYATSRAVSETEHRTRGLGLVAITARSQKPAKHTLSAFHNAFLERSLGTFPHSHRQRASASPYKACRAECS